MGRGPFPYLFLGGLLFFLVEPAVATEVQRARGKGEAGPGLFHYLHDAQENVLLHREKFVVVRGPDVGTDRHVQGEIATQPVLKRAFKGPMRRIVALISA